VIKKYILAALFAAMFSHVDASGEQAPVADSLIDWASFYPTGQLPKEIFGIPCSEEKYVPSIDSHILFCFPEKIFEDPTIGVIIRRIEKAENLQEMIADAREAYHESGILKVVREEKMGLEGKSAAFGFRAIYQTNNGNRFVWVLQQDGYIKTVSVSILAPTNYEKLIQDVENTVYGAGLQVPISETKAQP
jgi:hypothetical protein